MNKYPVFKLETKDGVDYRVVVSRRSVRVRSGSVCVGYLPANTLREAANKLKFFLFEGIRWKLLREVGDD